MNNPLIKLSQRIGYTFNDISFFELALTHRSKGGKNNERLEFLGDSIVNFVVAEALFEKFPQAKEGKLSRLRAGLVRGTTLAELARDFDLGEFLLLGSGELKSGGFNRESILADAVEAIIGAIYLDSGLDTVRERILTWYGKRLDDLQLDDVVKDAKTRLQEHLQKNQSRLPKYEVMEITGQAHDQNFKVSCWVETLPEVTIGLGSSRRLAEQSAAQKALNALGVES
ncbi:ribonuclease III [Bermanella marisrubri]|uniref:Ribonuclease 3 n=1 Tax=Bermanella marisrubri TaxID=207949 RepID=Q1MXP8_9GAMM|nr:ribonuclease III [Bermanella marisrubri]EAT10736.1 ribonuclease III [Oceanobacter sp. RED65] [Bermanella marisrubri]QIZ83597.1 ribonuclease III [Bermanella marisrubri]